jgi:tRNA pseudouridine55 synthase
MAGIINLNKPAGMTSRRAVDIVARLLEDKRVGHAGTLDPLASGVLVVCVGWATRLVSYLQQRPKRYRATFRLGVRSETDDVEGTVIEVPGVIPPVASTIEACLARFVGLIEQVPPQHSAAKVAGVRAYHHARRGRTVDLKARTIEVQSIKLVEYSFPDLHLEIDCGSGTYIRSIGRDLGKMLGCGAVMTGLIRTAIGEFTMDSAVSPSTLTREGLANAMQPPLAAVAHLPQYCCTADDKQEFGYGRSIPWFPSQDVPPGAEVAVSGADGDLVALTSYDAARRLLRPRQVFFANPESNAG